MGKEPPGTIKLYRNDTTHSCNLSSLYDSGGSLSTSEKMRELKKCFDIFTELLNKSSVGEQRISLPAHRRPERGNASAVLDSPQLTI